jgi:FixJ family two-component response regulator
MTDGDAHNEPHVFVIDDDASVRSALRELLESVGLNVIPFESPAKFLRYTIPDTSCCIVLDVRLPEMTGLKLQEELAKAGIQVPFVFLTAHGDIEMAVAAMKNGGSRLSRQPFRTQALLDAVFAAIGRDRLRRNQRESLFTLRERFSALTLREKEVLFLVAAGRLNKQIALDLGISETMVKVHRADGLRKMHANSVAELVRMTDRLHASPQNN